MQRSYINLQEAYPYEKYKCSSICIEPCGKTVAMLLTRLSMMIPGTGTWFYAKLEKLFTLSGGARIRTHASQEPILRQTESALINRLRYTYTCNIVPCIPYLSCKHTCPLRYHMICYRFSSLQVWFAFVNLSRELRIQQTTLYLLSM